MIAIAADAAMLTPRVLIIDGDGVTVGASELCRAGGHEERPHNDSQPRHAEANCNRNASTETELIGRTPGEQRTGRPQREGDAIDLDERLRGAHATARAAHEHRPDDDRVAQTTPP